VNKAPNVEILISRIPGETRLAFIEDYKLVDLVITHDGDETLIGNIYLGKVEKVVRGINAAFIDIGHVKAGFLAANDGQLFESNNINPKLIAELFKEGDPVLVQVTRDPSKGKGAKLTTQINLTGRTLLTTLGRPGISISRKIGKKGNIERLKSALKDFENTESGYIIRTNAQHVSIKRLQEEAGKLMEDSARVLSAKRKMKPPVCLYKELDPILRYLRDFGHKNWKRIIVDERATLNRLVKYFSNNIPELEDITEFANDPVSLFENYELNQQIEELFLPQVHLPSGGVLTIEETAALVAIDVDSRGYNRSHDCESLALEVNADAAVEVARQLILRNLAGQIVIDFLPMKRKRNRQKIQDQLAAALVVDGKCYIYGFSRLGLLEMTRQRVGESLANRLLEKKGYTASLRTTVIDMIRNILRELERNPGKTIKVACNHALYSCIKGEMKPVWHELLERSGPMIQLEELSDTTNPLFDIRTL